MSGLSFALVLTGLFTADTHSGHQWLSEQRPLPPIWAFEHGSEAPLSLCAEGMPSLIRGLQALSPLLEEAHLPPKRECYAAGMPNCYWLRRSMPPADPACAG